MKAYKRTPEDSFKNLVDFNYNTNYISNLIDLPLEFKDFRIAYIDENKNSSNGTIICLHGHPTWSYIWRHIIKIAIAHDFRIIAVDLPGFGKSDKPIEENFFNFDNYRNLIINLIDTLKLKNIYLFLHEWGGTLGLTLPMKNKNLYSGVVCFNSYLGNNLIKITESYRNWINSNLDDKELNVRALMARTNRILNLSECNAFEAPFPDHSFKLALKMLPKIFPLNEEDQGYKICMEAENWWEENYLEKGIILGSGRDPLIPLEKMKMLSKLVTSEDLLHVINNAGHFVPEWGMEFGNDLIRTLKEE